MGQNVTDVVDRLIERLEEILQEVREVRAQLDSTDSPLTKWEIDGRLRQAYEQNAQEINMPGANLSQLGLSPRVRRQLWFRQIWSMDQLSTYRAQQLLSYRNFGPRALAEVEQGLAKFGKHLFEE